MRHSAFCADPSGVHGYSLQPLILHAQLYGPPEILAALLRHGARPQKLSAERAFMAACLTGDLDEARRLATARPAWLRNPEVLLQAAQRDLDDLAALLLELGMPADLCPHDQKLALHWCGQCDSVRVARRLIAAGDLPVGSLQAPISSRAARARSCTRPAIRRVTLPLQGRPRRDKVLVEELVRLCSHGVHQENHHGPLSP